MRKIKPWPDSVFAIKTKWDDWGTDKHFWVHLERRAPGKFGRLQAMHAIVPKGRHSSNDPLFGSARYRSGTLDGARSFFQQAGVPDDQVQQFMDIILREYPYPTDEEKFREQMNDPLVAMILGQQRNKLSYHRTGVAGLTTDDVELIKNAMEDWGERIKTSSKDRQKVLDVFLGRGPF